MSKSPLAEDFEKAKAILDAKLEKQSASLGSGPNSNIGSGPSLGKGPDSPIDYDPDFDSEDTSGQTSLAANYEMEARLVLTLEEFKILKRMASYISSAGHPEEEACILAGIEFEQYEEMAKAHPIVVKIIDMKKLQYKHALMRSISKAARTDEKRAEWLLERLYPEEYAKRKPSAPSEGGVDIFREAVIFVQQNGDSKPIVSSESATTPTDFARELGGANAGGNNPQMDPKTWLEANVADIK